MATELQTIGIYAFLLGIVIAIIAGLLHGMIATYAGAVTLLLVVLGLIVGFLNIKDKEISNFLIGAIALMVVGSANLAVIDEIVAGLGTVLQAIINYILVFVAPAALIVALKRVYMLAKGV